MKAKKPLHNIDLEWEVEDLNQDDETKDTLPAGYERIQESVEENPEDSGQLDEKMDQDKDSSDRELPEDVNDQDNRDRRKRGNSRRKKKAPKSKAGKKASMIAEIVSWVATLAAAVALAFLLKNFVIINATVPTGSMENTIMPGDDILGFRLAYLKSEPQRGDVVIFKFPDDESQKYVKRIIGLPGETVTIDNGKVYINNSPDPLEEDYLKEEWVNAAGPYVYQVPENSYFVMGDNRNDSYDSRYWTNTFVTKDKIIGKALFIYFPFDHLGKLEK